MSRRTQRQPQLGRGRYRTRAAPCEVLTVRCQTSAFARWRGAGSLLKRRSVLASKRSFRRTSSWRSRRGRSRRCGDPRTSTRRSSSLRASPQRNPRSSTCPRSTRSWRSESTSTRSGCGISPMPPRPSAASAGRPSALVATRSARAVAERSSSAAAESEPRANHSEHGSVRHGRVSPNVGTLLVKFDHRQYSISCEIGGERVVRRGRTIAGRQPRAEDSSEATGDRVADSGRARWGE